MLGGLYTYVGNHEKGERYLHEAMQIRLELGSPLGIAIVAEATSGLAMLRRDWETATASTLAAIQTFEQMGAAQNLVMSQSRLGHILRQTGDVSGAREIYRGTIRSWQELGNVPAVAHQLECFAFLRIAGENYHQAAWLIGASGAIRKRLNAATQNPMELADMEQALAQLAEALGPAERDQAMAEGGRLTEDEAVALALQAMP